MQKTQLNDGVRNIKKRIVSYLSICLVIMLGLGVFLNMRYMSAAVGRKAADYLTDLHYKDFEFISTLGSSDDTIERIKQIEGVTDAEGVMIFDAYVITDDGRRNATLLSMTERISTPKLVEGELAVAEDECLVGEDYAEKEGISVGDRLAIHIADLKDRDNPLKKQEFTVSGLMMHPDYAHRGATNTVVMPRAAFDMSATSDAYTRVFVKTDDVPLDDFFTDAYFDATKNTKTNLEAAADALADAREQELKDKAYAEIDKQWVEAEVKLAEAENEIENGRNQLNSELAAGRKKLNDAEDTLASELRKKRKKIRAGEKGIKEGRKELEATKKEVAKQKEILKDTRKKAKLAQTILNLIVPLIEDITPGDDDPSTPNEKKLAQLIIDDDKENKYIRKFVKYINRKDVKEAIEEFGKEIKVDLMPTWEVIASLKVDELVEAANDVIYKESPPYRHFTDELKAGLKLAQEAIETLLKHLDEAEKKIAAAEKEIKKTEAFLDKKEAELKAGKKAMKEKKAEAEAKIRKGWAEYYSKKSLYEGKLAEAIALLAENREEAEAKLAEAKSEVEEIDGKGLVIDRNSCTSYIDVKEQIRAVNSAGLVFGLFFLLVTGLVCFSTITIIIEEQKKLLGTVKAFGFRKKEVLAKYLLFGGTAAVIGSILAFLGGVGLCSLVLKAYATSNLYQYGEPSVVVKYKPFIIVATCMLLVCILSTIIACTDILKSPASMLMKDESLRSNKAKTRKKKDSTNRGSLYSRLILRNMKDDMARVVVSTAIVAVCTCLLGIGFNFRFSFTGMIDKQDNEVYKYDFRIDYSSNVTPEQKQEFKAKLDENSAEYTEAVCEAHLFKNYRGVSGLEVIAGNADELPGFINPTLNGESVDFSTDGIMLPLRMSEVFKHDVGDDFVIYDSEMNERTAPVTELYHNYFGRHVLMSKETYESMFGERFEPNAVYVRASEGADVEALKASLLNISEEISFAGVDSYKNGIESIQSLYDIIVYVLLGIAILMSFLILTNLANIFLKRKKTELSVMRVNGFSVKQARGYLAKESVVTTVIGLVIGVIMGTPLAMVAIRLLEPTEMQFDRSYHVLAWVLSVAIEGIFAFIVYRTTFRKVKNLNLRDIAD